MFRLIDISYNFIDGPNSFVPVNKKFRIILNENTPDENFGGLVKGDN